MALLLVTYDLNAEGKSTVDYKKFYEIRDRYEHVRLSESSYVFITNDHPMKVYVDLKAVLDDNDYLYVISLKRPYYGHGPKPVDNWLEANLPH
jgi:hypothetical protein